MKVIGRADHQQVELLGIEHGFERSVLRADIDAVLGGIGQTRGSGIDIAGNGKVGPGSGKDPRQIAQPIAKADNANTHAALPSNYKPPISCRIGCAVM